MYEKKTTLKSVKWYCKEPPPFPWPDVQVQAQCAAGCGVGAKEEERPELWMGGEWGKWALGKQGAAELAARAQV